MKPVVAPPSRMRLRLLTQNLWHGLDHTKPLLMPPKEGFLKHWVRLQAQAIALRKLLEEAPTSEGPEEVLEVFCLQEVNPINRRMKQLRRELGMRGTTSLAVNVGLRAGEISYPFFLQEGLGILWRGALEKAHDAGCILSGHASEIRGPFGIPFTLQLAERRGAQLVAGEWHGKKLCFVNLHLHNGAPARPEPAARRAREIDRLVEWIDPWVQNCDAVFVLGDFNCEQGDAGLSTLRAAGFEEILPPLDEPVVTWDPEQNPFAKASLATLTIPEELEWDSRRHQIDHVFFKARGKAWTGRENSRPPWTFKMQRVFDAPLLGTYLSDHFGLLVDISWASTP